GVHCVLALSGGGATALARLLSVPGASRCILEAVIPYHPQALVEFLGSPVTQFCSAQTSRDLARRALDRASWLAPGEKTLGLGCTASLVSDRPKRGPHRVFVSTADRRSLRTWALVLSKGGRDRIGEETIAATLILHAFGKSLTLSPDISLALLPGESMEEIPNAVLSNPFTLETGPIYVTDDAQLRPNAGWHEMRPMVLVPGSFNPLHSGHWRLAEAV